MREKDKWEKWEMMKIKMELKSVFASGSKGGKKMYNLELQESRENIFSRYLKIKASMVKMSHRQWD